jgi:hypothetical protein
VDLAFLESLVDLEHLARLESLVVLEHRQRRY